MEQDIRWELRFSNFVKALKKLTQAVTFIKHNFQPENNTTSDLNQTEIVLDEMIKEALIQRFEYTHELAWNVMKDYATYQGNSLIGGSRDATREAYQIQLIQEGKTWMDMIASRNKTTHTYNEETAVEIYTKILNEYYPAFLAFQKTMEDKISSANNQLF